MACASCPGGGGPLYIGLRRYDMSSPIDPQDYPKTLVTFHGPIAPVSVTGLVTRIKYGFHKDGDRFWIHKDDLVSDSEMFTVAIDDPTASLPTSPDQVRVDEPVKTKVKRSKHATTESQ